MPPPQPAQLTSGTPRSPPIALESGDSLFRTCAEVPPASWQPLPPPAGSSAFPVVRLSRCPRLVGHRWASPPVRSSAYSDPVRKKCTGQATVGVVRGVERVYSYRMLRHRAEPLSAHRFRDTSLLFLFLFSCSRRCVPDGVVVIGFAVKDTSRQSV